MADRALEPRAVSREARAGAARRQPGSALPAARRPVAGERVRARAASSPARPAAPPAAGFRTTPPPRPAVTGTATFPVASVEAPRPRMLRLSVGLWFAACVAGLFGVGAALADGVGLRDRLTATASEVDPTATAEAVRDAVGVTIMLVLGTVVLLVLLTLVWTVLVRRRRSWARWVLLVTGLVSLLAVDLAQSTVAGGNDVDRIALVTQAGLVMVALVLLFTPSSRRWLRGVDA
jgi:hypothetical protein